MSKNNLIEFEGREASTDPLNERLQAGAQKLIHQAVEAKLCALVIIAANERGEKYFLAIEDGVRESTQSWREVLLGLKSRGMNIPRLAIGDGAMGFWAELEEVYPTKDPSATLLAVPRKNGIACAGLTTSRR